MFRKSIKLLAYNTKHTVFVFNLTEYKSVQFYSVPVFFKNQGYGNK